MTESNTFAEKQRTIAENVEQLTREHPEILQDYRLLVHYYHYYVDGLRVYVPLEVLRGLTQPESITRAFRKLVESGVIVPDVATQASREIERQNYRKFYGGPKP